MFFGIAALTATLAFTGCDTRADADVHAVAMSAPPAEVRLISDFSSPVVDRHNTAPVAQHIGATADSLHITRIRTLVSAVQFHEMETPDSANALHTFKSAPMLLAADADSANAVITQPFEPGRYDVVKLNIEKMSDNDAMMFAADMAYRDFIAPERPTMIIKGKVFKNGVAENFTYTTDATASIDMELRPPIRLNREESGLILLRFDPYMIFKSGATVLDPRDAANKPHFDRMVQNSLRALKR
jgi:hypothetical protein